VAVTGPPDRVDGVASTERSVGGRVSRVSGPLVEVEGLDRVAMLHMVELGPQRLPGEVVAIRSGRVTAQAHEYTGGLKVGDPAVALGYPLSARLGPGLLGRIFDGLLRPLTGQAEWLGPGALSEGEQRFDGSSHSVFSAAAEVGVTLGPGAIVGTLPSTGGIEHRVLLPPGTGGVVEWVARDGEVDNAGPVARVDGREIFLFERWPVRVARPAQARLELLAPLRTGQRVLDLLFPLARGASAAVPGGFGTGKTLLLQQVVKWCDADVIVFVGCGERGNELADALADLARLSDPRSGRPLLERTVVIANTSNMPVMAREASIYTGMTIAEYYRDMGYDAVLLADSTSRWAEALREFASRSGELPAEEGYPASLASSLAAFYERAGRFRTYSGADASVTAIGAVSPPGGDMTEPVTAHTERFVRALWSLDRDLAYARHYPALTWRRSFTKDADRIGSWHAATGRPTWAADRARAIALLAEADRLSSVVELVGLQAMPARERVVLLASRLLREGVLQQSALSENDAFCEQDKESALLALVLAVYEKCLALVEAGTPVASIEELDLTAVTRVRDELAPDDAVGVGRLRDEVIERLDALR
jgi:V/A-type H+-transporting ATPase subunit A